MSTSLEILENVWNTNPGGLMFAQYADALQKGGRSADAKNVLSQGLANWPRHFAGRMLLGQVNQQLGDLDGARVAFQEAVAMDNRSPAALRNLATLLGKQQYQRQAIDLWARMSMLDPEDVEIAATARKMIQDLETTSSLADLGMAVRDFEDVSFREALTEGASSAPGASKGLSGMESDSPLANWAQPEASPQAAGFDLGDLAFATPPSNLNQPTSWSVAAGMDSTMGQVPVQKPQEAPLMPEIGMSTIRMASDDSALATIEMASFPARTIPPPPLEMPRPSHPGNETGTKLLNVALGGEAVEATQLMPRTEVNRVTGDDVGARLDDLFGESELDPGPGTTAFANVLTPPEPIAVPSFAPPAPAMNPPPPAPTVVIPPPAPFKAPSLESSALPTRITGDDIEGRLSEIFEEASDEGGALLPPPPPAPVAVRPTPAQTNNGVTGEDIEARLDDLFGGSSVDLPIQDMRTPKSVIRIPDPSSGGPVTGHDVEAKLNAMFGSEVPFVSAKDDGEETSAMERSQVLGEESEIDATATLESMRSFQAAAIDKPFGSMDPSDVDSGGSTMDLPTVGALPVMSSATDTQRMSGGKDVDSQLDELFASSEFLVEPVQQAPQRAAGGLGGPITGDDIGDRLDDLFGADSDFPAGVPTVTLAEEYLRQGYRDQAVAVYKQLVSREPGNMEFARRLAQIEATEG